MKYAMYYKPIAILCVALLAFSACKKDADKTYEPPVIEPLSVAASKPGDTLIIRGKNFSETAADNIVKINGVEAPVVSAAVDKNATALIILKVVIPANAASGAVAVTVHGNTVEAGSIVIAPLTFYAIKGDFRNGVLYQLITVNPENGNESLVVKLSESSADRINDVTYLPATNEIVGLNDDGDKLTKINVTTKQISSVPLPVGTNTSFEGLVVDNNSDLYSVKYNKSVSGHYQQWLSKIDPATGNIVVIKTFENNEDWESLQYISATNDIVGLTNEGSRLLKVNLTSTDTSSVKLPVSNNLNYDALVVDDKSNLYGYKTDFTGSPDDFVAQLLKLNTTTGQESLFTNLPADRKVHDKIIFVPQRNEFITFYDQVEIIRIHATSKAINRKELASEYDGVTYNHFTSN